MDKDNNCIGLALSGGGYRAAAYHLGTLRALYKLGLLNKIDTISSVSGGSIVSAYYLLHLGDFKNFDERFYKKLGCGVMHLAFLDILLVLGIFAALGFLVSPWLSLLIIPSFWFFCYKMFPLSWLVELQYRWLFFGNKTLSDLPDKPSLVINTTDVAQGCLFKFSKNRAWGYNYQNRMMQDDDFTGINFPISTAVMASSCVPFAFTPLRMPEKYRKKKNATCPLLVDGGLYDNQGVHELGENGDYCAKYIIVSNAGNSELDDKRRAVNEFLREKQLIAQEARYISDQITYQRQKCFIRRISEKHPLRECRKSGKDSRLKTQYGSEPHSESYGKGLCKT